MLVFNTKLFFLSLLSILAVTACHRTPNLSFRQAANAPPDSHAVALTTLPVDKSDKVYNNLHQANAVIQFYSNRSYKLFWLENDMHRADCMIALIHSARRYGLLPQFYHVNEIAELNLHSSEQDEMLRLEVILTDAFFSMAHDVKRGRMTIQGSYSETDSAKTLRLADSLSFYTAAKVLASQEPKHQGYLSLKHALNYLLDTVQITDQKLLLSGTTLRFNPIHQKVQQIEINIERWRNEVDSFNNLYALVNIPAYTFYVVVNDKTVLESRVIVGAPITPTPELSSAIECFTIYPYWYVPRKIAVKEYLPILKKDTTFITRNNFDVLDKKGQIQVLSNIDWKKYNINNFPFVLRQREGRENSLGVIKFIFDNPYAVYLHDTNAKRLFKSKARAFSHGCVRLEKAVEFAHYLIGDKRTTLQAETLDTYLREQRRVTISLARRVPIYIRYFTCEVRNNELQFYPDIYQRDQVLLTALYDREVF